MADRLYLVTYTGDDGDAYEGVFPESALPTIEEITEISIVGWLAEGYKIVLDEEPDDPEKEPIPISSISR